MINFTHRVSVEQFKTKKATRQQAIDKMAHRIISVIMFGISFVPGVCFYKIARAHALLRDAWGIQEWTFLSIFSVLSLAFAAGVWVHIYQAVKLAMTRQRRRDEDF